MADTRTAKSTGWYPKDPKQRALVDEYLDQHHLFLRYGMTYTILEYLAPRVTDLPLNMKAFKKNRVVLTKALNDLERRLKDKPYLCGQTKTIADLLAAHELY